MAVAFGRYLIAQQDEPYPLGQLARDANKDVHFPKDGDRRAVIQYLRELRVDEEFVAAAQRAADEWAAIDTPRS